MFKSLDLQHGRNIKYLMTKDGSNSLPSSIFSRHIINVKNSHEMVGSSISQRQFCAESDYASGIMIRNAT
jgi:hypothetical protein